MARIDGQFDPVTDPTSVYNQYQGGTTTTFGPAPLPGSVAITTINSISGPTVTFSGGSTGLTYTPGGTTITLGGTLAIANGGTNATTAAGARTNLGLAKQNSASVAPAVTDDTAAGYSVNSLWTDTVLDDGYMCVDATNGAAIWKKVTP